jgi:hypothetical protein
MYFLCTLNVEKAEFAAHVSISSHEPKPHVEERSTTNQQHEEVKSPCHYLTVQY